MHIRVNSFTHGFADTLAIPGTDSSVSVTFADGSEQKGENVFAAVTGTGIGGQDLRPVAHG